MFKVSFRGSSPSNLIFNNDSVNLCIGSVARSIFTLGQRRANTGLPALLPNPTQGGAAITCPPDRVPPPRTSPLPPLLPTGLFPKTYTRVRSSSVAASGKVNVKHVPCPGWLSTPTRPPCACTTCLTIARPSPVPPVARAREASAR